MVKFDVSREEAEIILRIARRASDMAHLNGLDYCLLDAEMDITAAHSNGSVLRLSDLLAADDEHFAHDVFGIMRHINRRTGHLENCFMPRYSR